ARGRDLHLLPGRHEIVLHVDHHERGLSRRNVIVNVPASLPLDHAGDDVVREDHFVHGLLRPFLMENASRLAGGPPLRAASQACTAPPRRDCHSSDECCRLQLRSRYADVSVPANRDGFCAPPSRSPAYHPRRASPSPGIWHVEGFLSTKKLSVFRARLAH